MTSPTGWPKAPTGSDAQTKTQREDEHETLSHPDRRLGRRAARRRVDRPDDHAAFRRHASRGLSHRSGGEIHVRPSSEEHRGAHRDRGVPFAPARRGKGHHRADALRRHRHEPREPRAVQQPDPRDRRAWPALRVPLGRAHAQGDGRADRRRDPRGVRTPRPGRACVLRQRRAFVLQHQACDPHARRSEESEDPRPAVRPVHRDDQRARRQCDADAVRRGLFVAPDRGDRRGREQLAELRVHQALRGRQVLLPLPALAEPGSPRDVEGRLGQAAGGGPEGGQGCGARVGNQNARALGRPRSLVARDRRGGGLADQRGREGPVHRGDEAGLCAVRDR